MSLLRERAALLVVDMEHDFVHGVMAVPGAVELVDRLVPLLRAARVATVPVIFVTQALRASGADLGPLERFEPVRERRALQEHGEGVRVVAELEPSEDDQYVVKRRFSAFLGTDLDVLLRSMGIEQVVVCGVSAHVCCDTTVREAFQLGYATLYVSDGVEMGDLPDLGWGPVSAETAKAVVATTIAHRFGSVCTIADLLSELARPEWTSRRAG
jgi:nicotinamidase-related amidase